MIRTVFPALLLLLAACGGGSSGETQAPGPKTLPKPAVLPAYEVIPNSGPLVVLMAFDIQSTLHGTSLGRIPSDLIGAGFSLLALDLPCHGADATEPPGKELVCWRKRLESGDRDLFLRYCAGLSAVLDHLDAKKAYVVGQSRGGYVAATCAAYDQRLTALALIMPVTDLTRLSEFSGYDPGPDFRLGQYRPELITRAILVRIGNDDPRVGTDAATEFARQMGATLRIIDSPGHDVPEDGSTTEWLLAH